MGEKDHGRLPEAAPDREDTQVERPAGDSPHPAAPDTQAESLAEDSSPQEPLAEREHTEPAEAQGRLPPAHSLPGLPLFEPPRLRTLRKSSHRLQSGRRNCHRMP
jgi:hypothetical protein